MEEWISSILCCSTEVLYDPSWHVLYIILYAIYVKHLEKVLAAFQRFCSASICCSKVIITPRDVSENLRSKLKIEEIAPENVTLFIPKRLCVYLSFSLWSPLGKAVGTWILSRQEEIKQGVSQWHRESDNGTIEVLSIVALSLEKSTKKEIPPLSLSCVWLFILTFLSFSKLLCSLGSAPLKHTPSW